MLTAQGLYLEAPGAPLAPGDVPLADPAAGEALVEVLACGLCHTDLSFASGAVAPRHPLPLVLGHEVSGVVVAAGEHFRDLVGRPVLVPAVLPCGDCAFCRAGRANACPDQKMPGNDLHGGFSSHLLVPARFLVPLDGAPPGFDRSELAVVADAASTAFQAVRRAAAGAGDLAVVVGSGGVGAFVIQIARARGARVVALDVRARSLAAARDLGAEETLAVDALEAKDVRKAVRGIAARWGIPSLAWRIFECSGAAAGQRLAFALLGRASTLVQVGYTQERIELPWSNLMAFDATVHGTWGCPPEVYPEVLELIFSGSVAIGPLVDHAPLSEVNDLLARMAAHRLDRRMILHPD